jgi:hypothetical protein
LRDPQTGIPYDPCLAEEKESAEYFRQELLKLKAAREAAQQPSSK